MPKGEYVHRYVGAASSRQAVNEQLVQERIQATAAKRQQAELDLAKSRGEVIYKSLVQKQATYLLVNLRQKILNVPSTYARRLVGIEDIIKVQDTLREMSHKLLDELKDLPNTVTDPDWLLKLEKKELDGE